MHGSKEASRVKCLAQRHADRECDRAEIRTRSEVQHSATALHLAACIIHVLLLAAECCQIGYEIQRCLLGMFDVSTCI
jgi:hypothetical protein